jgi:uncharacterized protein
MKESRLNVDSLMNPGFSVKQEEFVRYIRDPAHNPAPADVKPERMAMYRELIYNNIDGFLSGNFPVIRKILDDNQWHSMVQDFIVAHKSETPYFAEIAEEFLAYLEHERKNPDDLPFLLELAHYEWVEMVLAISPEEISANPSIPENLLAAKISLSPLAWPLAYCFPVHHIAPEFMPLESPESPTFLLAFRDKCDMVRFNEISPMVYRLLEIIQEQQIITVENSLNQITTEFKHLSKEKITEGGLETLTELIKQSVINLV